MYILSSVSSVPHLKALLSHRHSPSIEYLNSEDAYNIIIYIYIAYYKLGDGC